VLRRLDYQWQVLVVIAIGTFMVILDTTIVNIALPRIITVFGSSVDEAQLVITGYMLALATIVPAAPWASQTFGSKRMYLTTLALFTLGSVLCGLAWSVPSLVLARVIQGLGGGMIGPIGMAMLFRVTPPEERGTVMSKYAMPVMLGPLLGPTLGGFLVEYVDWRWVFLLNLPPGLIGLAVGSMLLRETPTVRGVRFDLFGFVLAASCSAGALLGLSDVPEKGWDDPTVVALLTLAAVTLPIFVWWQLTTKHPLLNLRLFAIPAFSVGAVVNFVTAAALFGGIFLLPLFLQNVRGLGAMETGMLLLPQSIASFIAIQASGRLYDRVGPRPLVLLGLVLLAIATGLFSKLDVDTPNVIIQSVLVVRGVAMGLTMMPSMTAWLAAAPVSQAPSATALNNVLRQLFAAFGTAMYATLLQQRIGFHYETMAMALLPDAPAVMALLAQLQHYALSHGLSLAQAKALMIGQLVAQVRRAAAVQGFNDAFLLGSIACVVGLIPAFFLKKGPARQTTVPAPTPTTAQPARGVAD
jgi:EmrB/QacA subfamily drug resistance transporter